MQNISPSKPREIYALDLYGPLPKARVGNKFILVIVDVFSKFVQAYPINKPTSRNCLAHLKNKYIIKCGVPEKVLSDHGSQFTSEVWGRALREMGIKVIHSTIRHPQSNPCERIMRELSRLFRVYCGERHTSWPDVIPHLNIWLNEVPHESIGMSPHEAHFGVKPKRSYSGIPDDDGEEAPQLERVRRIVMENMLRHGRKRARAKKGKTHQFVEGSKVLLKTPRVSDTKLKLFHKFFPIFSGPYMVRRKVAPNAVELEEEGGEILGIYNFRNLIPYVSET
jgi:transposase InsO family protein